MKKGPGLRAVKKDGGGQAPTSVPQEWIDAFMDLFQGRSDVYGRYEKPTQKSAKGKQTGIGYNVREPLTEEQWRDHFLGKYGVGVVPTQLDKMCWWGALDIDVYTGFNHVALAKKIQDASLPLITGFTKSGGAHVWMFASEPVPAVLMRSKMREIAGALGEQGCEVNPKQAEILDAKGDMGSWLNMPYFGGESTSRYAIDPEGKRLSVEEFIHYAMRGRQSEEDITNLKLPAAEEIFPEGPPCLQYIGKVGLDSGERNKGLMQIAIFWKKADDKGWKQRVEKANQSMTHGSPLDAAELAQLLKSIEKKDYNYSCKEPPIMRYCNSGLCRTRRYGVSGGDGMPAIGQLTQLATDPPIWFLDIEDTRIELTTEQIQSQTKFQLACMEKLRMMPPRQKENVWQGVVQNMLEKCLVLDAPSDASVDGEFFGLLEGFCSSKSCHPTKEGLLMGKPYKNDDEGRTYFRLMDLLRYLHQHGFKDFRHAQLASRLKKFKDVKHGFTIIDGRGVNHWSIPVFEGGESPVPLPEMRKKGPF